MPMITPQNGWGTSPQRHGEPIYTYDPALAHRSSPSLISDLRNMGSREARQLSFGAAFGATSGFLMARLCMALLKFGVFAGVVALLIFISWVRHPSAPEVSERVTTTAAPRVTPVHVSSVFDEQNNIQISPENPYRLEGNYSGWALPEMEKAHRQFLRDQYQWEIEHPAVQ
jgi:hypothetical protein